MSGDVDSSVIGPETLRFCTTEQMRKVLNKVIQEYILFIPLLTLLKSEREPCMGELGTVSTCNLDKVSFGLIEDLIVEMQRVVRHVLKTRVDEVDTALRNATLKFTVDRPRRRNRRDRLRAEAALIDGNLDLSR